MSRIARRATAKALTCDSSPSACVIAVFSSSNGRRRPGQCFPPTGRQVERPCATVVFALSSGEQRPVYEAPNHGCDGKFLLLQLFSHRALSRVGGESDNEQYGRLSGGDPSNLLCVSVSLDLYPVGGELKQMAKALVPGGHRRVLAPVDRPPQRSSFTSPVKFMEALYGSERCLGPDAHATVHAGAVARHPAALDGKPGDRRTVTLEHTLAAMDEAEVDVALLSA